jgi:MoxR-like ATPase
MRIAMGYPDRQAEGEAVLGQLDRSPLATMEPVIRAEEVVEMQEEVSRIHVDEKLLAYILDIVEKTRTATHLRLGASPRGSVCLTRTAQAHAALEGRDFISPYDVKHVAAPVLSHRVLLSPEAMVEGVDVREVVAELVDLVTVPAMGRVQTVI